MTHSIAHVPLRAPRSIPAAVALAAAVSTLAAGAARAQSPAAAPDSLPARAGSWALEGGLGSARATLGALRFVAPRTALGIALVASSASQTSETTASSGSGTFDDTQRGTSTDLSLDLGYRRYARPHDALATFLTAGPTLQYLRGTNSATSAGGRFDAHFTQVGVGAFGELGAAYLPVRRVSVNASAQLRAARLFGSNRNAGTTGLVAASTPASEVTARRTRGWTAEFGLARLSATLFF